MSDDIEARVLRFRAALLDVGVDTLRSGVQRLPKQVSAQLHKTAGVPFPALAKMPDPTKPLRRVSDVPLLDALADAVMHGCYEATLDLLGDRADEPAVEDLREVLPELQERFPVPLVRLVFASVAISTAVAADACDEVVRTDLPQPADPDEPASGTAPSVQRTEKKGASDELREARKERRRAQQEAKRKQQEAKARAEQARRDALHAKNTEPASSEASESSSPMQAVEVTRRPAALTPAQAKEFDPDDPLAGKVVVAMVPFDEPGKEGDHKRRPCIVVAGSASQLLVRPCYSEGGLQSRRWQSHALLHWRQAGFDKQPFVEDDAVVIARVDASDPLGEVSAEDWNALW